MTKQRSGAGVLKAPSLYLTRLLFESFWFMPGLLLLGGIVLAALTLTLDRSGAGSWLQESVLFFELSQQTARPILATMATAMATVSSLVFSLMFVALTIASQQLGPRIISRAMADPANRIILGTFVSTFVFALTVLGSTTEIAPTPYCSITVAFVLVIFNFAYLFYFVHHNALSMQADSVLAWLADELNETIRDAFPEKKTAVEEAAWEVPKGVEQISSRASGYVQVIGFEGLCGLAADNGFHLWLRVQPGDYVIAGTPLVELHSGGAEVSDACRESIRTAIVLGPRRTAAQDYAFRMRAIVDIGVRALSPSLNDFHTANTAIDWVTSGVAVIFSRGLPPNVMRDAKSEVRIVRDPVTEERVLQVAYQHILEAAAGHLSVLLHLLWALTVLATLAEADAQKSAVAAFGLKVEEALGRMRLDDQDQVRVEEVVKAFRQACA